MVIPRVSAVVVILAALLASLGQAARAATDDPFDHSYELYGELLRAHVKAGRVDYVALKDDSRFDLIVDSLDLVPQAEFEGWTREQRLAFWINAYNIFTLKAIVDHYPIDGGWSPWSGWFSLAPRNSIRQIDGVWDHLTWQAAGRTVTLDDIEHVILRPTFKEPRIHFAINCASVSCPPLRSEPYVPVRLEDQLEDSSRQFLASELAVRVDGTTLRVTSVLDWYGEDFIDLYAELTSADRSAKDRAILGAVLRHGPPAAAALAKRGPGRVRFLAYDWSLNDVPR